ncbi:tyrosinase family protein [Pseudomonas sp. Fl5BN2]|uniref:tyrosinase family protein n=1 Tax=unclassified Pseudomonas TaxID=196821 RepID=UPI0013788BEB|nr:MULTISPECIES: tyrosinase family protein [unclassified Pseudomonas]NBF04583.1 tyrosinase family protein [Pseudomonas sp. Fl5BN2]NBF11559.1 tyrosinase family protein [Pseudomonas sp. Fl4BN1]
MVHVRRDVWKLTGDWDDTLLWYAKAVGVLQQRPITDPTSWRFLAAIHGFNEQMWRDAGYLKKGEKLPSYVERKLYWKQCQHSNWFFVPWHRGYVVSFEKIVRDAIVKLGGPQDWALPYWNYNEGPQSLQLPACFAARTLPQGGGPNPLYVERRYGPDGDGKVVLVADLIQLGCLEDAVFEGGYMGNPPGFGGTPSTFSGHKSGIRGGLEARPHNIVHTEVGGEDQVTPVPPGTEPAQGLMSFPETAALDPIFWLHHANIDRLWQVWLDSSADHQNPDVADWYNGPTGLNRDFVVPTVSGHPWKFKVAQMLDTLAPQLDYRYDTSAAQQPVVHPLLRRLTRLGLAADQVRQFSSQGLLMSNDQNSELIGANHAPLDLVGNSVQTSVVLDKSSSQKVFNSLKSNLLVANLTPPDRVFLNLENIRGKRDSIVLQVYINLPPGADPALHPELRAGVLSLFGLCQASRADDDHGGHGITEVFEITDIIDTLHLNGITSADQLNIRFISKTPVRPEDQVTVSRVSITRLGG